VGAAPVVIVSKLFLFIWRYPVKNKKQYVSEELKPLLQGI